MKPKIIIIDGADCVGKSLIARLLAEHFNTEVKHTGKPDPIKSAKNPLYQYEYLFKQVKDGAPPVTILDRSWYSGIFYSVMRRLEQPNLSLYRGWEKALSKHYDLHVFYVSRPWYLCCLAHREEILNKEGWGNIEDRSTEHLSWASFFQVLEQHSSLNLELLKNDQDVDYAVQHVLRRIEGSTQRLVYTFDTTTKSHYFTSLWLKLYGIDA